MSKRSKHFPKSAGILLPLFSVPDDHGPGTLYGARDVVQWAAKAGFSWWQMLPLTLPDSTGSPYASPTSIGWGWHIIDREGLVTRGWVDELPTPFPRRADRRGWDRYQRRLLWLAWKNFATRGTKAEQRRFEDFCQQEAIWLDRHALFLALRDRFADRPWWTWPARWRTYETSTPNNDQRLKQRMEFHSWVQWVADEQWQEFRSFAHQHGIKLIGDVPFFVRADSVAVWSQPELFAVQKNGGLTHGAGAPPDSFSTDGQWWGNPTYDWPAHTTNKFAWWRRRLAWAERNYDAVRLDHFHGYLRTWMIPAASHDATRGTWLPTPPSLLRFVQQLHCPVVVEDLGVHFPAAEEARKKISVSGTRVWEFGWNGYVSNPHALAAIQPDVVYYSSTHDLPPIRTWMRQHRHRQDVKNLRAMVGHRVSPLEAIQAVMETPARLVVFPVGDLIQKKVPPINKPGTMRGNWRWQLRADDLTASVAQLLKTHLRRSERSLL